MHPNILTSEQLKLLPLVKEFFADFYLVGGTALAFQYGHRRSTDFDLFSKKSFNNLDIRRIINKANKITGVRLESEGELTLLVENVKMTFLHFEYPVPHTVDVDGIITAPDDLTIGAMKAFAMGQRSKWKDYVDLYFIFQHHSLQTVIEKTEEIFGKNEFNSRLFREQLAYHRDINYQEEIEWMPGFEVDKDKILSTLIDVSIS